MSCVCHCHMSYQHVHTLAHCICTCTYNWVQVSPTNGIKPRWIFENAIYLLHFSCECGVFPFMAGGHAKSRVDCNKFYINPDRGWYFRFLNLLSCFHCTKVYFLHFCLIMSISMSMSKHGRQSTWCRELFCARDLLYPTYFLAESSEHLFVTSTFRIGVHMNSMKFLCSSCLHNNDNYFVSL